jgi:hypothetical protein
VCGASLRGTLRPHKEVLWIDPFYISLQMLSLELENIELLPSNSYSIPILTELTWPSMYFYFPLFFIRGACGSIVH